ncbi:MAG TPA: cytidylate kinase-like family protein [Acidimicrobiia bacterium]|nr:cytidylate kinase-like family protein [Acidimicrobiia bacterium]
MTSPVRVVTISATYGAGGTIVAPAVAERLQLPYLDRLVSPPVAHQAYTAPGPEQPGRGEGVTRRLLAAMAALPTVFGTGIPQPVEEEEVREEIEASIRALAEATGGVLLGRGATMVLADTPGVFHVRLDGPPERRVRQAMTLSGVDEAEARKRQREIDRARTAYLRRFYDTDGSDPRLYHFVLDSTAVTLPTCAELIVTAATTFWATPPA